MTQRSARSSPSAFAGLPGRLAQVGSALHILIVAAAVAGIVAASVPYLRAAVQSKPVVVPATMEDVDWKNPDSSIYCLACHRQVAPAMAGLNVEHGHPQNVPLNVTQLQAVAELGTVAGPDGTLICMTCHKLGQDSRAGGANPHMLADTLVGSRLCERCHPGHYAHDTPHDLRQSAPQEKNRLGQTVAEGGPCSACHLAHRYARDFKHTALDPDGRCVTCHQAYQIAAGHARTRMEHPESHCIQCHNPHDMANGEFLKTPANELCLTCHTEFGGGVARGMHPLGTMPYPLPQALVDAGARMGRNPQELTCLACHVAHGSKYSPLLVMEADSNRLCLTCHEEKLAQRTHERILPRHGQSPVLANEQRAVVNEWGTRVGPGGELLCVSCHRVHGGQRNPSLLAFTPKYGETCLACHPQETGVLGTSHDLRTNFPQEKNIAGLTPGATGACSACHLAHGFGREFASTAGDPAGQCATCHEPGGCAQAKLSGAIDHPDTKCTDCHNPHDRRYGKYLIKADADLCTTCHVQQVNVKGGPHDRTQDPEPWPKEAAAAGGVCLSCHVPHGGARPDLLRITTADTGVDRDGVCLACHSAAAWNAASDVAAIHPRQIAPDHSKVDVALVPTDAAGNQQMGCRTCHDPHGGANPAHLARVAPEVSAQDLCLRCHTEKQYIKYTGHSAESLAKSGMDVASCKPCHAMHAKPTGTWGQMLSPRFLQARCEEVAAPGATCVPCLGCHNPNGPAPVREVATHPDVIAMNIVEPNAPGYLPLFNADGREDPSGQVVCRTCHVSHGRLDLLRRLAENPALTPAEQHAIRTQVRAFVAPNVCTACHGAEARNKFLHFHDPAWRPPARANTAGTNP